MKMLWNYRVELTLNTPPFLSPPWATSTSAFRSFFLQAFFQMLWALHQEMKKQLWAGSKYTWVQWGHCSLNQMWEHFFERQNLFWSEVTNYFIHISLMKMPEKHLWVARCQGVKTKQFCTMELGFSTSEASEMAAICLSKSVLFLAVDDSG